MRVMQANQDLLQVQITHFVADEVQNIHLHRNLGSQSISKSDCHGCGHLVILEAEDLRIDFR